MVLSRLGLVEWEKRVLVDSSGGGFYLHFNIKRFRKL